MKKTVFGLMPALLLISMFTLTLNVQPVKAGGTIYIRADGSVEGTDKIQRAGHIYTFTDNINDSIVVEKDNIMLDGAGYTLQGTGSGTGIDLTERNNITNKNMTIKAFSCGIYLHSSSNINISDNNVTSNFRGIWFDSSSNNNISRNNITNKY